MRWLATSRRSFCGVQGYPVAARYPHPRPAARRRAVLVVSVEQRLHPRRAHRRGCGIEDAADDNPIGQDIVIIVLPLAGRAGGGSTFEDEGDHSNFAGSKSAFGVRLSVRLSSSLMRLMRPSTKFRILLLSELSP